jgi:hypothetical protein
MRRNVRTRPARLGDVQLAGHVAVEPRVIASRRRRRRGPLGGCFPPRTRAARASAARRPHLLEDCVALRARSSGRDDEVACGVEEPRPSPACCAPSSWAHPGCAPRGDETKRGAGTPPGRLEQRSMPSSLAPSALRSVSRVAYAQWTSAAAPAGAIRRSDGEVAARSASRGGSRIAHECAHLQPPCECSAAEADDRATGRARHHDRLSSQPPREQRPTRSCVPLRLNSEALRRDPREDRAVGEIDGAVGAGGRRARR